MARTFVTMAERAEYLEAEATKLLSEHGHRGEGHGLVGAVTADQAGEQLSEAECICGQVVRSGRAN